MSVRSLRYNTATQHFTKSALASTDRDALAFLEAAQIYNTNQQRAIVNLVRSLKRVGLWSKMKAIYPFVGGTASSHKWNLKDPRDVDAAFRLSFSGGWTHSSTGAAPNGSNAYANTFIVPSTDLTRDDLSMTFYSRTRTLQTSLACDIASYNGGGSNMLALQLSGFSGTKVVGLIASQQSTAYFTDYTTSDARGFWNLKRTGSLAGDLKLFLNGNNVGRVPTLAGGSLLSNKLLISAMSNSSNDSIIQFFSNKESSFVSIGNGLTDSEASNLYTIVDLFQKRLGRAV